MCDVEYESNMFLQCAAEHYQDGGYCIKCDPADAASIASASTGFIWTTCLV